MGHKPKTNMHRAQRIAKIIDGYPYTKPRENAQPENIGEAETVDVIADCLHLRNIVGKSKATYEVIAGGNVYSVSEDVAQALNSALVNYTAEVKEV